MPAAAHLQLCRGGVVDQQEAALLVLHRDAGRQHLQHIPKDREFGIPGEFAVVGRCGICGSYGLRLCMAPTLTKWSYSFG